MTLDEAIGHAIAALQDKSGRNYGYDLHPSTLARNVAHQQFRDDPDRNKVERVYKEWSPIFFDAAWELCRRGILRPGVIAAQKQAVDDGGYSITGQWIDRLDELDETVLVLVQPGSLAATFKGFRGRFGDGFHQRSQEAIKCRNAEAWLACCAMVGASAELILLAVAIEKTEDEETVLKSYQSGGGRAKVLNLIAGKAGAQIQRTLTDFTNIVSLWRDDAAHGQASELNTANADEALRQLLHMCQWIEKNWDELVA